MHAPPETLRAALAGRCQVEREFGQGGMATVYLARDLKRRRRVAIKIVRPDVAAALEIERLLAGPSWLSVHTLRLDPRWDPTRNHPRFQALLKKQGS